jgi:hypothetical protein
MVIVFTIILGAFIFFPTLTWSRSHGFYGADHVYRAQKSRKEIIPKDWEFFNYRDKQMTRTYPQRRKKILLHAKENRRKEGRSYKSLSPEEKSRVKGRFRKWQSLPEERQRILRRRMEKWKQLPLEERELFQQWFQQWQKLSPDERWIIRKKLKKWDILPPGEQDKVRQKFSSPKSRGRP